MDFKKLSKKRKVYFIVLISLIGVMLWAFITAGIITRAFNREQLSGTENSQQLDIEGIILTETKGDKKYWEIYGETGSYSSDNKIATLKNMTGNFYSENDVSMSFQSSKGTYDEEKKQIIMYEDTHIVIQDGTNLYCDKMVWSGSDKPILANGHIKIVRNGELVSTAQKAVISADYSNFKIMGKTITKLYDKNDDKTKKPDKSKKGDLGFKF